MAIGDWHGKKTPNVGSPMFAKIKSAVVSARSEARRDAQKQGRFTNSPFIRSRGTFLATLGKNGQCMPNIEAEGPYWNGTKKEIVELVSQVLTTAEYVQNVDSIYIAGAFDMSDRMDFDDYEPRVAEWSVTIWTAADGYIDPSVTLDTGPEWMKTDRYGNILERSRD